jgi:hypothetical protein
VLLLLFCFVVMMVMVVLSIKPRMSRMKC